MKSIGINFAVKDTFSKIKAYIKTITIKKILLWILDFYNPKTFVKVFKEDFKKNKVTFFISFALTVIFMLPVAFADISMPELDLGWMDDMFAPYNLIKFDQNDTLVLAAEHVYDALLSIGIAMATAYWAISMGSASLGRDFSVEIFAIQLTKLVIVILILENGWNILSKFVEFGDVMIIEIKKLSILSDSYDDLSIASPDSVPIADVIRNLIPFLLILLCSTISMAVVYFVTLSRKVKLTILLAMAPIGCADISGGLHSSAAMYIRNILAYCIQGVLIYLVARIGIVLMTEAFSVTGIVDGILELEGNVSNIFKVLAVVITICGMYAKTEQLAKTICGTH